jgi:hypothetical protein
MKKFLLLLIVAAAFGGMAARADEPEITGHSVALDAVHEYRDNVDQLIHAAVQSKGKFSVDPNVLTTTRALEYELLGHVRLGVLKRSELPVLVFAQGKPQSIEEIPGRVLELRLLKLNINPWQDGLSNRVFEYTPDPGYESIPFKCPCPTHKYPRAGDFRAAYGYGMALIGKREWHEAARHLAEAAKVPGGTLGGVWEFQIEITRAWAEVMCGNFTKARAVLSSALAREHQCEVPIRARFLASVLGIGDQHLPSDVAAALPNGD